MTTQSNEKESTNSSGRILFAALFGFATFMYLNSNPLMQAGIAIWLKIGFETAKFVAIVVSAVVGYFVIDLFAIALLAAAISMVFSWLKN